MNNQAHWDSLVKSFKNWDVYYLSDYVYPFALHGDGEPLLVEYQDEEAHFCYVIMKSDISTAPSFSGRLEKDTFFDLETPYGYGGPLSNTPVPEQSQKRFLQEMTSYCKQERIVSQFVRFHPLLNNHTLLPLAIETRYLRDTIYIDTVSPETIMANMDSKNRNMVRKAIKNGVSIEKKSINEYAAFLKMYNETMLRDDADPYYMFQESYFDAQSKLSDNAFIFYAMKDGLPIAGSIIYYNEQFAHYHLSGSHASFRKFAPSNLLLYEVACWASGQGIKRFHLGGGLTPDDNLFGFKKQFNKNGRLPFVVGRTIFDVSSYKTLLALRKEADPSFPEDNNRMIQYRL